MVSSEEEGEAWEARSEDDEDEEIALGEIDDSEEDSSRGRVRLFRSRLGVVLGPLASARESNARRRSAREELEQHFRRVPPARNAPTPPDHIAHTLGSASLPSSLGRCRPKSSSWSQPSRRFGSFVPSASLLSSRETSLPPSSHGATLCPSEKAHLRNRFIAGGPPSCPDRMMSRGYISKFSNDGSIFVGGFQDRRIRLYDYYGGWSLRKDVQARLLRWTITDTALTSDGQHLVYTSINPFVHLVGVGGERYSGVDSVANVTDVHECLELTPSDEDGEHFGIWSVKLGSRKPELIAGASDSNVYVYDMETKNTVARAHGHSDEVNAVAYADSSDNVILSGSDDSNIMVWDRRTMGNDTRRPSGVVLGHTQGLTHIDPRSDGRYFISNGKDQALKLFDIRKTLSPQAAKQHDRDKANTIPRRIFDWDYRWMPYPGDGFEVNHPHDQSVHTFRGHKVLKTLIRCYWSPESTGERYIYTGSSEGGVHIFDSATGKQVRFLDCGRGNIVRDCAWHPNEPNISCVSWDGAVMSFGKQPLKNTDTAMEASEVRAQKCA